MCFKNKVCYQPVHFQINISVVCWEELTSHMREFNAVDQKVFHRKMFITADEKWLIFSFDTVRMCESSMTYT